MRLPETSVIIATLNRCAYLKEAVESLMALDFPCHGFEVIIVDNGSTDGTREFVLEYARSGSVAIRYIMEERQGISFARNRGVQEAKGQVIAFLDDDAVTTPGWLQALLQLYRHIPGAGIVGGPIKPVWIAGRPPWLTKNLEMSFGILDYGSSIKRLSFPQTPFGGNFSIKRELFCRLGGFYDNLGRKGARLLSSEEVLLCGLLEQEGKSVYYTPEAVVYHKILPHRLTKRYLLKRAYAQGISNSMVEAALKLNEKPSLNEELTNLLETIKGTLIRLFSQHHTVFVEDLYSIFFLLGKLRGRNRAKLS